MNRKLTAEILHGARIVDASGVMWGDTYWNRINNGRKGGSTDGRECIFCGRNASRNGNSDGVYVSGGGGLIVHPDDYATYPHNGGDMGWFPVGAECIKRVPEEFRLDNPYANRERMV
jgi:hypothetical protein